MKFRIGPWTYRVEVTREPAKLTDEFGKLCDGRCSWSDRVIYIDEYLALEQRHETLTHELSEAYEHHFGTVADHESLMQRQSTINADINRQFDAQGGIATLARMTSTGMRQHGNNVEMPSTTYSAQCPYCQTMIAIGSIINSAPRFDAIAKSLVLDRSFTCENCDRKIAWVEGATVTGLPNGNVVVAPTIERTSIQA